LVAAGIAWVLADTADAAERWVVVFSPTGCEVMLRCLGLLDGNGRAKIDSNSGTRRSTFIVAIGPTTRDHLITAFGFTPDACAGAPSPEGVREGLLEHMSRRTLNAENRF
jgi:uroporphyrinogen-III synthase